MLKDPTIGLRWATAPLAYTWAQRNKRDRSTAFNTALNRLFDMIEPNMEVVRIEEWVSKTQFKNLASWLEIDRLGEILTDQGSDKSRLS